MRVTGLSVLALRNVAAADVALDPGVTLLWGPNGAGKTTLLEAVCLALTGRSPRTRRDREAIRFGEPLARVEAEVLTGAGERHEFMWSLSRAGDRRHAVDGRPAAPDDLHRRPPLAIFLPDRLGLVKGLPSGRRAHLDRLVAALWTARTDDRRRYGRALGQRNALLRRIRAGEASPASLDAWDAELAQAAAELQAGRRRAVERLAPAFRAAAADLGLGDGALAYRPRCRSEDPEAIVGELRERRESDLARGWSGHGPHFDDLELAASSGNLRHYGSQGEQRAGLLALLFAERTVLAEAGRPLPLLLLDDVTSELDAAHRELLASHLARDGQSLVTATDAGQLPASCDRRALAVRSGSVIGDAADREVA